MRREGEPNKLDLPLEDRVARSMAAAGNVEILEGIRDIMTAMFEEMMKAGANASPLVAHYDDNTAVIQETSGKKIE